MTFGVGRVVNLCSDDIPDDAHCSNQSASSTTHTHVLWLQEMENTSWLCAALEQGTKEEHLASEQKHWKRVERQFVTL